MPPKPFEVYRQLRKEGWRDEEMLVAADKVEAWAIALFACVRRTGQLKKTLI